MSKQEDDFSKFLKVEAVLFRLNNYVRVENYKVTLSFQRE